MADHSDFSKNRINVMDYLEGTTFDTDVNKSLVENTFNRFLTKDETTESIGLIGVRDAAAAFDRQLKEDTVHRQTYQLQPLVHSKVATVDYTMSFKDILAELERLGVDISRMDKWANTERFNFAPPVDMDKLINYRDYYWHDPDGLVNEPQYIVIKNPCSTVTSRLQQRKRDIAGIGSNLPLISIDLSKNEFVISNDATPVFLKGTLFDVTDSATIEGLYEVESSRYADGKTFIKPTTEIPTNLYNGAFITFASQIAYLTSEMNKVCGTSAGWDAGLWDDISTNTGSTVEAVVQLDYLQDNHPDMFALVVRNHPEYVDENGIILITDARPIWAWMDGARPEFNSSWDGLGTRNHRNAWQIDNKWMHKLDLPTGAFSKSVRAEAPIMEYFPHLQLNEWTEVKHQWMYREDPIRDAFQLTDAYPTNDDYEQPDFLDKWIYVGKIGSNPIEPQAENPNATVMTTDLGSTDQLDGYTAFTIASRTGAVIKFIGNPTVPNGTVIRVATNNEMITATVTSSSYDAATNTKSLTLATYGGISAGHMALIPTTAAIDVVIFPTYKQSVAFAGTNAPRVYVDEEQLIGTYSEITVKAGAKYYVAGIKLDKAVSRERRVDVGIDPAAAYDEGRSIWNVRRPSMINDKDFAEANRPTEQHCLLTFYKQTQGKPIGTTKIPMFDLFYPNGTTARAANQIFFYVMDPDAKINKITNMRLKTNDDGTVYTFEQLLINEDDGPMLCYKDLASISAHNPTGLQTIWRTNINEEYVPQFVDVNRRVNGQKWFNAEGVEQTTVVDETNGDWEIISQLLYNSSHENRKQITSTELTEHVTSINRAQATMEGFLPSLYNFRLYDELNYGVGGTIKEHNGSVDTLASALFVTGSSPTSVISYAQTAYETALSTFEDYVLTNAFDFLTSQVNVYIADLATTVTADAISAYESNDNNNVVFGDSVSYVNGKGIKNWPATAPMLGLSKLYRPTVIKDSKRNVWDVLHHDGHYDTYFITAADQISIGRRIVRSSYTDENFITRFRGWTPTQAADKGSPVTSYNNIDWTRLRPADAWVNGQEFKRFEAVDIGPNPPAANVPDGAFWVREPDGQLMVKVSGATPWVPYAAPAGDVSAAWKDVNLSAVLNQIILTVETKLFEAAEENDTDQLLNESLYIRDEDDVEAYNALRYNEFEQFVRSRSIIAPYASVYRQNDPFTWNYSAVDAAQRDVATDTYTNVWNPFVSNEPFEWAGYWAGIYLKLFGTAYPHLEPWVLQGYSARPEWWNEWYADTTGTRRWNPAMWTNVLSNRIPAQYEAPSAVLYDEIDAHGIHYSVMVKKFTYVPVNIARRIYNTAGTTVIYDLDDLFPPFDSRLFLNENLDIVSGGSIGKPMIRRPSALLNVNTRAAYVFGDVGPVEWTWVKTTNCLYSTIKNAFLMQPIRFVDSTWGTRFDNVAGLKIDKQTQRVYSHWNTIFHGDVVDGAILKVFGLNQWYVNYNRSSGLDFKVSNFRQMWTTWKSKLAYQFGCYINTKSLDVSSTAYDMIREDFNVVAKKSPAYESIRADGLYVTVANYGNFRVHGQLKVPVGSGADWSFSVDVPSNEATVKAYGVRKYEYTVVDPANGIMQLNTEVPWTDGEEVHLQTSQYAPYPLDTAWTYYVSTVDGYPNRFRLSRLKSDAMKKVGTVLRTTGSGVQTVSQTSSTFVAHGGAANVLWKHHVLDKTSIQTVTLPHVVVGVQGLIDFVDGYAAFLADRGIRANHGDARENDPFTGRLVSWQTETERAIDKIYTGLGKNNTPIKQYGTTYEYEVRDPDDAHDVFELKGRQVLPFEQAEEVYLFTAGAMPEGAALNTPYYVIPMEGTAFRLASTPENAFDEIGINVTTIGTGKQYIGSFASSFVTGDENVEINPFRNNVWIETDRGVVSNVFDGGNSDANNEVTLYDQYGRPLPRGSITVLRQDRLTRVSVRPQLTNDVITATENEYNYLHIGGINFYLDGFEHVVLFNNYTTEGYLIYDPYIGMDVTRLSVSFNRSKNKSLRPSIGGYYYDGGEMVRNLEASVTDMRSYYDTYGGTSVSDYLPLSRALLGYEDPTYLDQLNTQERAKFLFWKGMIQRKGSKAAIAAFINSKHFVDARCDEFWAYKVADFGDARQKYKPEIKLHPDDAFGSDLRYEFLQTGDIASTRYVSVTYNDDARWVDILRTKSEMKGHQLYFDAEKVTLTATIKTIGGNKYFELKQRLNGVALEFRDGTTWNSFTDGNGLNAINDRTFQILGDIGDANTFWATGYTPAVERIDPIAIVDSSSSTVIGTSKCWNPHNGQHNYAIMRDVDFMSELDPARYDEGQAWTTSHVGKKWVDMSTVGFVPYDDITLFPEFNDRMSRWGRLAGWSSPMAYEWVRSTRAPADFEAAAAAEEGNMSIPLASRASGVPYKVVKRVSTGVVVDTSPVTTVLEVSATLTALKANASLADTDLYVYVNGTFVVQKAIATLQVSDIPHEFGDYVTFVPRASMVIGVFEEDYKYLTVTEADERGNDVTVYYFWAGKRNTAPAGELTAAQISALIAYPSDVYHLYAGFNYATPDLPVRYSRVVIRGIAPRITAANRYIARFTRDFTLRDDLASGASAMDLKNKHAEWVLFREQQPYKISQALWDKMSEALVGYELEGFDGGARNPVPTLTRTLHDAQNGTTTRFGMERGQAFVDREMGLATVQRLLETATFDTAPIDKYVFLELYTFDTPVNIRRSLQYIFMNFSDTSVNRMFFEVLHDALSVKSDFSGLFMTSFVALHGIKILETSGSVA